MTPRSRLARWRHASGHLKPGTGIVSGTIAFALAFLCLLGVIGFHFPEYTSTPDLRARYSIDVLRQLMFGGLILAGGLSLSSLLLDRQRGLNLAAFALVLAAIGGGGPQVPIDDFPANTPYIGLDWFILDLLGSTLLFLPLEKRFPLYPDQPIFRREWQTDLIYFLVNHLLVGLTLLIVNFAVHRLFGWATYQPLQSTVRALPFAAELFVCVLAADLAQYWIHRAYHRVPFLWRVHAIHHSAKVLDWIAGSRLHLIEVLTTRVAVLGVLYVLGFSKPVMDAYILIVGFHAVLNHANVELPWGPLHHVIVTPAFHHWHHASDRDALDCNFAAHFSFLDALFGTVATVEQRYPRAYGVLGEDVPEGFLQQQLFPFRSANRGH